MAVNKPQTQKQEKPRQGVQFVKGMSGTDVSKAVLAAAMEAFDAEAAAQVLKEKDWRFKYSRHFVKLNELAAASPQAALQIARTGLASIGEHFTWADGKGVEMPLPIAMQPSTQSSLQPYYSAEIAGSHAFEPVDLKIPMPGIKKVLSGDSLLMQMGKWVARGVIEPSAWDAVATLVQNKEMLDLRGHHFVLLGAGSAMGPIESLLSFGATVHAVELPRPAVWKRLLALVHNSPGRLVLPLAVPPPEQLSDEWLADHAGCNLTAQPAAVADWVVKQAPSSQLVLGTYVYLDGAMFSQVAVAADAISQVVCAQRGGVDSPNGVALAYLNSPTEVHCIPDEAHQVAKLRASGLHCIWEQPIRVLSRERYLEPNRPLAVAQQDGSHPPLLLQDSVVWSNGPNYQFAKQLQKWRAIVARSEGHLCSCTVGPATLTESVMHNRLIAAGMLGCEHFGVEAFHIATSNSLLAAMLIWDVKSGKSSYGHPAHPLRSPLELFQQNSCHGGTWRCAFKTNSYTEVAAIVYFMGKARPWLLTSAAGLAALKYGRAKL